MQTMKQAREAQEQAAMCKQLIASFNAHILSYLPDDCPCPSLSNHQLSIAPDLHTPRVWMSFPWDADPQHVADCLTRAGFSLVPASLVKWDNYRPTFEPGPSDFQREHKLYTLTWTENIAPFHIVLNGFTAPEVIFFAMSPHCDLVRVSIDIPQALCPITASAQLERSPKGRVVYGYKYGTVSVQCKPEHYIVRDSTGEPIAEFFQALSAGSISDDRQQLGGRGFWQSYVSPDEWPLSIGSTVRALLNT